MQISNSKLYSINNSKIDVCAKWQINAIYLCLFSSFFGLISFGKIGTMEITPIFLSTLLYLFISIFGLITRSIKIKMSRLYLFLAITLLLFISSITSSNDVNISSTLLYIYYFSLFLLVDSRITYKNFNKTITIFIIITAITSLYGIYQFLAYNIFTNLPLKEIIPKELWVSNMNVVDTSHGYYFNGREMYRVHSIYSEASVFSQFCAIAFVFAVVNYKNMKPKTFYFSIIINFIALILSLSGTGIIIIVFGLIVCFIQSSKKLLFTFFGIVLLFIIILLLLNTELSDYFFGRTSELYNSNGYSSGYYRFVLPFKIGIDNPNFFGSGPGNDDLIYQSYGLLESTISNGFGKIFVELGFIGLLFIIIFFVLIKPKKDNENYNFLIVLFTILICLNFVGSFMTPIFWSFTLFATIGTNYKNEEYLV